MQFDDRLATVLRFRAEGAVVQRVQLRQLLDLLGKGPMQSDGAQEVAAYSRLGELAQAVPPAEQAQMIGDSGLRLRSPRLVALLANAPAPIAVAAVGKAELSGVEWLDLLPAMPAHARETLRQRRDIDPLVRRRLDQLGSFDRGLPPAAANDAAAPAQPAPKVEPVEEPVTASAPPAEVILPPEAPASTRPGIGAIVERIEAYRRARQTIDHAAHGEAPRLPLGEDHVLGAPRRVRACDFATDVTSKIVWADPGAAPMLVGTTLGGLGDVKFAAAVRSRQPLRALTLELTGPAAIAGTWHIDAAPRFDPLSAAFVGYHGRLRRPAGKANTRTARDSEADRVRQMLHELRTPVNAIQGFAEVIQQQLFGPTPHEYRAHAASIAGDAARILAAFDELERLARLESGVSVLGEGSADFAAILSQTAAQLGPHTRQRSVAFQIEGCTDQCAVAMAEADAQSLAWRLLATLGGAAAPGEQLSIFCNDAGGALQISFALPAALRAKTGDSLFEAGVGAVPQAISAGVFGVGFALRLARAEAAAAGGDLKRVDDTLHLRLPGLTAAAARHSDGEATTG
jgi:two-component system, OmpR family, sensor kinase